MGRSQWEYLELTILTNKIQIRRNVFSLSWAKLEIHEALCRKIYAAKFNPTIDAFCDLRFFLSVT